MTLSAGIDVGSGAVKAVIMNTDDRHQELVAHRLVRIRKREIDSVIQEAFLGALKDAGTDALDYVATTGEGEEIEFATGHFYGMTTHARGGLYLQPGVRTVLDIGALHARAISMDERGKVEQYKMTSQCASGSGQFLENIARYLGVSLAEVGELSLQGDEPEGISSICAVLAETDVINMVSRGITPPNILKGIHLSMGLRYVRLLRSVKAQGTVLVTGGLAQDKGLLAAIQESLEGDKDPTPVKVVGHSLSQYAGALGAAIWGGVRYRKLNLGEPAWTKDMMRTSSSAV